MKSQLAISSFTGNYVVEHLKELRSQRSADFLTIAADYLLAARRDCNLRLMAEIYFEECVYHNHVTSQYKQSNVAASKCLGIATKLRIATLKADALRMVGVNYNFLGDFTKASKSFQLGIELLEEIPVKSTQEKKTLAGLYFNLVSLHKDSDFDEKRVQYLDTTFQLYSELNDKQGIARTYIMYANYSPGIKGTEKVVEYFEIAARLFKEVDDNRGLGNSLVSLGNYYCNRQEFEKSLELLNEGITYLRKSGSAVYIINGIFNLALAYKGQGKYKEAIETFKEVEELSKEAKTGINLTSLYLQWSLALEQAGDYKGALELHKKFHEQKENVFNFDKHSAISDTKMMVELEVRKKEAENLRKKNKEIEEYARKIEVSNFELRQFAHVASHDLKEPLHMVSSYMQLLERRAAHKLNESELEFLTYAKEGAKRMYGLIDSLLCLSKINNQTAKDSVDLNGVLDEVIDTLHLEIEKKKFKIIRQKLPVVMANKTHMIQLFQNMVSNAMKYNESETPQVEIRYLKSQHAHYISFCDNGIGISSDYREKVFEIFQRLHTREQYSGTGIGLTICKKIVDQLGGKIWIEASKSGGSSFKFTIPV